MGKNITPPPFPTNLSWDDDASVRKSLKDLYSYADGAANDTIGWYFAHKRTKGLVARGLRFAAIILTTVGGVIPLLVNARVGWFGADGNSGSRVDYAQFGYVFLALAAGCVALDRFFGYSSGWIRYVTSALNLQRLQAEFQLDWAILTANLPQADVPLIQREAMLRRVQSFILRMREEIEKETAEWAAEYRSNLTELEKTARTQLDAWKPGVINLTIPNAPQLKEVTVLLDDRVYQTITTTTCQIAPVYPGQHTVAVTAKAGDKPATASSAVAVTAGQAVALILTPVPA
jgi:hypothetical protein